MHGWRVHVLCCVYIIYICSIVWLDCCGCQLYQPVLILWVTPSPVISLPSDVTYPVRKKVKSILTTKRGIKNLIRVKLTHNVNSSNTIHQTLMREAVRLSILVSLTWYHADILFMIKAFLRRHWWQTLILCVVTHGKKDLSVIIDLKISNF